MARNRYRFTPARRRALKKAQTASARKRRGRGRGRKAALVGAGVIAVGVGAYLGHKHSSGGPRNVAKHKPAMAKHPQGKMVVVHHITQEKNVASIEKHGLRGSSYGPGQPGHGMVHVTTDPRRTRRQAHRFRHGTVVSVKVSRHHLRPDMNEGGGHNMMIDPRHIKHPVRRRPKKRARKRG